MNTLESQMSGEMNEYGRGQPLPQFALLILIQSVIQLLLASLSRAGRYPTVCFWDLVLLGIGTHKLSRIVAKSGDGASSSPVHKI
jgi:hypothetical protein